MLREVSIEILRKCPNYCLHCSSLSDMHCNEIMDYNLFASVVDDAVALGATTICLSGGEPFLHPDIVKLASYMHEKGIACYIYTSGVMLDDSGNKIPLSGSVLKPLAGKVTKLIFNVEAATEATYDKIMGTTGCFDIMKQSALAANKFEIVTEAHFVPMRLNIDEIEQAIELCKDLKISKISFLRLVLHGRALHNASLISLTKNEIAQLKMRLENIKASQDIQIRVGVPLSLNTVCHKCEAASGKLNIKYTGEVFPCEVFKNNEAAIRFAGHTPENIKSTALREIYKKSSYLKSVRVASQEYTQGNPTESCIGQYLITRGKA